MLNVRAYFKFKKLVIVSKKNEIKYKTTTIFKDIYNHIIIEISIVFKTVKNIS